MQPKIKKQKITTTKKKMKIVIGLTTRGNKI